MFQLLPAGRSPSPTTRPRMRSFAAAVESASAPQPPSLAVRPPERPTACAPLTQPTSLPASRSPSPRPPALTALRSSRMSRARLRSPHSAAALYTHAYDSAFAGEHGGCSTAASSFCPPVRRPPPPMRSRTRALAFLAYLRSPERRFLPPPLAPIVPDSAPHTIPP
ncbi:hypothetical protein B0H15DRAFT_961501 [Mycena belliarum]|uniref:Uncharacterized protein n=1 Tax=Mycena belliarum TaxID=1033014 RepID=A0AAD6XR37_9AGAR|nr:hypothetical protein B0H15DRAFT_961501 [Mycena belliae]